MVQRERIQSKEGGDEQNVIMRGRQDPGRCWLFLAVLLKNVTSLVFILDFASWAENGSDVEALHKKLCICLCLNVE